MSRRTAMFSLLPSVKRDWIKALRSGDYEQSVGSLYDSDDGGFCCLGVLCAVTGAKLGTITDVSLPQGAGLFTDLTPTDDEVSPKARDSYDLEECAWMVRYGGKMTPLSYLNDEKRLNFNQIADIIEKNVPTHR